ncbi:unnamed protein product [Prorocentrum cordatum]|uniref:Secreted protein n=1 Tax=Prorocentrum cordatum TaxID=2364126 RepID=A0ABN9T0E5_9DINO|nr:unnamed protein product [Polarella glacialis]
MHAAPAGPRQHAPVDALLLAVFLARTRAAALRGTALVVFQVRGLRFEGHLGALTWPLDLRQQRRAALHKFDDVLIESWLLPLVSCCVPHVTTCTPWAANSS